MHRLEAGRRAWVVALGTLGVALATACEGQIMIVGVRDDDGAGAGRATGWEPPSAPDTKAAAGSGSGREPGGDGPSGADAVSSAAGGQALCEDFANDEDLVSMTIRVRNDTPGRVYLPVSCGVPVFALRTAAGGDYPGDRSCVTTCGELQMHERYECPPCKPESQRLEPGESLDIPWDGRGLVETEMPLACFADPADGDVCTRAVAAPSGKRFTVDLAIYSACGVDGTCACGSDGRCAGAVSGTSVTLEEGVGDFLFGTALTLVEVSIGPCAFGCANG